jgi:hypothetical protein
MPGPFDTPGRPPAPPVVPTPTPKVDVSKLTDYSGIFFDRSTGKTYREDGTDTGWTFERATWTGPFGLHLTWPWLNPISFATAETAERILAWARRVAHPSFTVDLDDRQTVIGPFTRTVERLIVVTDKSGRSEQFSAGWLANSFIRHGEKLATQYFLAELWNAQLTP